jgi:hypothetical protein
MATDFPRSLHAVPDPVGPSPDSPDPSTAGRALLEQAKGMLMIYYGVPQHEAFGILIRWSTRWNVEPPVVAATLVEVGVAAPVVVDTPDLVRAMARAFADQSLTDEPHHSVPAPLRSV